MVNATYSRRSAECFDERHYDDFIAAKEAVESQYWL